MSEDVEIARLVNEFTAVRLFLTTATASPRIRIVSDRTGQEIALDATSLEAITTMDHKGLGALVAAATETGSANNAIETAQLG
jgi:hypothetical protein